MNNNDSSYALKRINYKSYLAIGAIVVLSVGFGLLAVSANPILIGVGAGMVLGPALLLMPELVIWLILVVGLLMGILSASPQLGKVTWIISILSLLILLPSLINIAWSKQTKTPGFLIIALIFLGYGIVVSIIQWYSISEFLAGFKRYYQAFGLMFALTMIAFTPASYERWRKFLLIVALMQFPFALYELLVLVPLRGGLANSSESTDVVAGTFGANLQGGSPNSVMVIYLFIALSFLVARWRAKLIKNKTFFGLALVCLLPLGMGETKVAVFMLPLVGLILLKKELIRSPSRFFFSLFILSVLTILLSYYYVIVIMHSNMNEVINGSLRYNVGDQGYSPDQYLNRFTSITFWIEQQNWNDPLGMLIGHGLGSSFTSEGAFGGHMGLKYLNYGINLTAASTILWDTGLIGLILFVSIFIAAWVAAGRLASVDDPAIKADALAIQAAIALFCLSIVYLDSIVNLIGLEIIYAVVLGYLGYLLNRYKLIGKNSNLGAIKTHA